VFGNNEKQTKNKTKIKFLPKSLLELLELEREQALDCLQLYRYFATVSPSISGSFLRLTLRTKKKKGKERLISEEWVI
jgi:hypothetical protein